MDEEKAIEVLITVSLMNVANEQAEMIKNIYKHKQKQKLNIWLSTGNKLLNDLKSKFTPEQIDLLDGMTDVYHDQSDSIRKQIKNSTK